MIDACMHTFNFVLKKYIFSQPKGKGMVRILWWRMTVIVHASKMEIVLFSNKKHVKKKKTLPFMWFPNPKLKEENQNKC